MSLEDCACHVHHLNTVVGATTLHEKGELLLAFIDADYFEAFRNEAVCVEQRVEVFVPVEWVGPIPLLLLSVLFELVRLVPRLDELGEHKPD